MKAYFQLFACKRRQPVIRELLTETIFLHHSSVLSEDQGVLFLRKVLPYRLPFSLLLQWWVGRSATLSVSRKKSALEENVFSDD